MNKQESNEEQELTEITLHLQGVARWCGWLRHCATSRKIAGSIPDGAFRIFHWHNPYDCTMSLRLTRLLTEMSARNISWQPYHFHVPIVLKSGSVNLLKPSGPVQAYSWIALPLHVHGNYETWAVQATETIQCWFVNMLPCWRWNVRQAGRKDVTVFVVRTMKEVKYFK
jgi:hypothetical protein